MPANTNPAEYLIDLVSIDSEDPKQAALDHARIESLHHQCIKSLSTPDINNNAIVQHKQSSKGLVKGRFFGHGDKIYETFISFPFDYLR